MFNDRQGWQVILIGGTTVHGVVAPDFSQT